jgi:hypothetical protein
MSAEKYLNRIENRGIGDPFTYSRKEVTDFAEKYAEQLLIQRVGWQSEQLPDFDVQEINEILQDCKEKKENIQTLICRILNKGYMTAIADEREG